MMWPVRIVEAVALAVVIVVVSLVLLVTRCIP